MKEEQWFDLIEAYLAGELSAEDRKSFEDQLTNDKKLANKLKAHQAAHQLLEDASSLRLKTMLQEMKGEAQLAGISKRLWVKYISIAASILILALLGLWQISQQSYTDTELFAMYFEPYPVSNLRGEVPEGDLLQKGLQAYAQHDLVLAKAAFESIKPEEAFYIEAQLYLGNVLLDQGAYAKAISPLQEVYKANDSRFSEAASWYLLLAYLGSDLSQSQLFEKLTTEILQKDRHAYQSRVKELIELRNK